MCDTFDIKWMEIGTSFTLFILNVKYSLFFKIYAILQAPITHTVISVHLSVYIQFEIALLQLFLDRCTCTKMFILDNLCRRLNLTFCYIFGNV